MTCAETSQLIPLHALDALDAPQARHLESHVKSCATCRMELVAFRETAAHLATTLPSASPSPALRRRLLSSAAARPRPSLGLLTLGRLLWPSIRRLSPIVAVASVVVALAASFWAVNTEVALRSEMATNRALEEQLAAQERIAPTLASSTEMRVLRADVAGAGARAVLVVDRQSNSALLAAAALPGLPADRVYQLWLIHDGGRASGGTFRPDDTGAGQLAIQAPRPLGEYEAVGITVEPSGGSAAPTGPRVLSGGL